MMTINELERQLNILQNELKQCVVKDDYGDCGRILTGISTLKDTLLESYRNAYTKSIVSSISNTDINVIKDSTTNTTIPLRIVK